VTVREPNDSVVPLPTAIFELFRSWRAGMQCVSVFSLLIFSDWIFIFEEAV